MDHEEKNRNPSVSIIIPARNEHGMIEKIVNEMPEFPCSTEIVFVEGNSSDDTLEEIQRVTALPNKNFTLRWLIQDGKGKADAVWKGFDLATGDILIIYDADMTVSPDDLLKFYEVVSKRELVVANGSRLILPMEKGAMRFFNHIGNFFFAMLLSLICRQKFSDTLCGTKVIRASDYRRLKELHLIKNIDDPFGDFTLLIGSGMLGLTITEVPVHYRKRIYGGTKIRRWRDGWKLLKIAFKVWRADLKALHT